MFRFFENLVDPFAPYRQNDLQPRLVPFLRQSMRPFRAALVVTLALKAIVAASEIGFIGHDEVAR